MLQVLYTVTCGTVEIDSIVPYVLSEAITIIKIFIPIALILFGMLDLGKAVMSNDEKTMKEGQGKFIKRCVYAIIVFFIVAIVQLLAGILDKADGDTNTSVTSCISCFVDFGNAQCNTQK